MESGTVLTCLDDVVGPTNRSIHFARAACNYTQAMWDSGDFTALKKCLMNISVEDGLAALGKIGAPNSVCWNMVQDNYFLPAVPKQLAPKRPNIPVIIGNCKDEEAYGLMQTVINNPNLTYFTRENIEKQLLRTFVAWLGNETTQSQNVLKIWEDSYLPPGTADDDHLAWLQFLVDVETPAYFTMGSLRDIQAYVTKNNSNVYAYQFSWSSPVNDHGDPLPNWHPAPHVCEIPYVFGYNEKWNETDKQLANLIQSNWANFVKNGKPTLDNSWSPVMSKNYTALEYFDFYNISEQKVGFRSKDQIVWNQEIPQIMGEYPVNIPDNQPVCTHGYTSKVKNTTCYEAFASPLNWNDAQYYCTENSYGTLVSITSAFENSDLLVYAKNRFSNCTGFYTGLFRSTFIENNTDWTWVNYDPSGYRNWQSGSPKQDSTANCVVLNSNDGTWTNQNCANTHCFVCSY